MIALIPWDVLRGGMRETMRAAAEVIERGMVGDAKEAAFDVRDPGVWADRVIVLRVLCVTCPSLKAVT